MKHTILFLAFLGASPAFAQLEVDRPIEMTGGSGERAIRYLEAPVSGTDAVNKDYVDAAVAGSGSGKPTMVSNESPAAAANFGDALRYCSSLTEGGHSDWYLPDFDEITYLLSKGGVTVSNNTSANPLWTRTKFPNNTGSTTAAYVLSVVRFTMSNGDATNAIASGSGGIYVRCVR